MEKDTGSNVKSRGAQCQKSREVFTFGEWLKRQEILIEAHKLFTGRGGNLLKEITDRQSPRSISKIIKP